MTQDNKNISMKLAKYTIGIVVGISPFIYGYANINYRVNTIETKSTEIENHFKEEEVTYANFYKRLGDNDVKYAEIKASLDGIKTMQQDILSRLSHN